jgi:deoxyribodipyrimidine photolyase-related protein
VSSFYQLINDRKPEPIGRRWLYVPYDQLTDRIGPLARGNPRDLGIVLVENSWKAGRRPYHKQKLALVLANQRHFALEQAARGVAVRYVHTHAPYSQVLSEVVSELGGLTAMRPAERELRADLEPLIADGRLELVAHEGWLTTTEQFQAARSTPPWRMDSFYRHVRRATDILMDGEVPRGGKFSFDTENRRAWSGDPPAPDLPTFPLDDVKSEVGDLVEGRFARHPGRLDLSTLPATSADAQALWGWAQRECLADFGPYQDAMSLGSASLFHTRISGLLNLHRLLPAEVVRQALELDLPLASLEGFIRQILGWREFVRHVHEATDGFRVLPSGSPAVAQRPGDGGYAGWAGAPWREDETESPDALDGGAAPSALASESPMPSTYWGTPSGLQCLDQVVSEVWGSAYGHHITRLMVLANIATLLDISPRQLTDWFWVAYADAYDWVVEPNVLGMGSFAVGGLMTTKPYVSGAAYIQRMSDYCTSCRFDPKTTCPITGLYWAFLDRHRAQLRDNPRLRLAMASLRKRSEEKRLQDEASFRWVSETLAAGRTLSPEDSP